jgi:hypothetical protein
MDLNAQYNAMADLCYMIEFAPMKHADAVASCASAFKGETGSLVMIDTDLKSDLVEPMYSEYIQYVPMGMYIFLSASNSFNIHAGVIIIMQF